MNFTGLWLGLFMLFVIGFGFFWVIKLEYYVGAHVWPWVLAAAARARLASLGLGNVTVHVGDGTLGLPEHAPFDGILVAAAAPEVPQALLAQLAEGGRLVLPVGSRGFQHLERWTRQGDGFRREVLEPVAFVPLIGAQGWPENAGA